MNALSGLLNTRGGGILAGAQRAGGSPTESELEANDFASLFGSEWGADTESTTGSTDKPAAEALSESTEVAGDGVPTPSVPANPLPGADLSVVLGLPWLDAAKQWQASAADAPLATPVVAGALETTPMPVDVALRGKPSAPSDQVASQALAVKSAVLASEALPLPLSTEGNAPSLAGVAVMKPGDADPVPPRAELPVATPSKGAPAPLPIAATGVVDAKPGIAPRADDATAMGTDTPTAADIASVAAPAAMSRPVVSALPSGRPLLADAAMNEAMPTEANLPVQSDLQPQAQGKDGAAELTPTITPGARQDGVSASTFLSGSNVSAPSVSTAPAIATDPLNPQQADFADKLSVQMQWMGQQKVQRAELQLHPAELGPLDIRLELDGQSLRAEFGSSHAEVRAAIESQLPRLRDMLAAQGFQLGDAQVGQQHRESRSAFAPAGAPGDAPMSDLSSSEPQPSPARRVSAGRLDEFA